MQRGFTIIEVAIVITIMTIGVTLAVPKLVATRERVHVDLAAGRLQSIWNAQRFYRLEHGAYAMDLDTLKNEGLLDIAFARHDRSFEFDVDGDGERFLATATRIGSGWTGDLTVSEQGVVGGYVRNREGRRVLP